MKRILPALIGLIILTAVTAHAAPPFSGTIFIDPDIITAADPTSFTGITYTGQGMRSMFDRRANAFVTYNAYLFNVTFTGSPLVEVQVNPEFGSSDAAGVEANKYAVVIGRLPVVSRKDLKTVWIHKGVQPFGGGNNNLLIHTGQADQYAADGILEETFVHESSHTSLDADHANSAGWRAAQAKDPDFISTYARDNPDREDVAESFLPWLALRYRRDRISDQLANTISSTIPNRLAYFDSQSFNLAPVVPALGLIGNVSTRLPVGTGDNVLIEGFIVQGPAGSAKKIIVRAIGPSLVPLGITDALANPTLEIHDASNATVVATNDNWKTTQVGGLVTADQSAEISSSGVAPGNDLESAIIANLAPGSYTAVVRGAGNSVGTGVVDAYDLSAASPAKLANVATRGLIQPGDKLMIAGFIIQNGAVKAVVRAIGPSLTGFGVTNALADTTLQVRDQNGAIVQENDDWQTTQKQELESTGLQPSDPKEAAVVATIPPGQYTAQVRGKPETTGIGVVQVYFLQ
jgi:hypothetical protein